MDRTRLGQGSSRVLEGTEGQRNRGTAGTAGGTHSVCKEPGFESDSCWDRWIILARVQSKGDCELRKLSSESRVNRSELRRSTSSLVRETERTRLD